METFLGIMIPFLGTTLGAACVFFMKKSLGDLVQRSLAGFAGGVMVAASGGYGEAVLSPRLYRILGRRAVFAPA